MIGIFFAAIGGAGLVFMTCGGGCVIRDASNFGWLLSGYGITFVAGLFLKRLDYKAWSGGTDVRQKLRLPIMLALIAAISGMATVAYASFGPGIFSGFPLIHIYSAFIFTAIASFLALLLWPAKPLNKKRDQLWVECPFCAGSLLEHSTPIDPPNPEASTAIFRSLGSSLVPVTGSQPRDAIIPVSAVPTNSQNPVPNEDDEHRLTCPRCGTKISKWSFAVIQATNQPTSSIFGCLGASLLVFSGFCFVVGTSVILSFWNMGNIRSLPAFLAEGWGALLLGLLVSALCGGALLVVDNKTHESGRYTGGRGMILLMITLLVFSAGALFLIIRLLARL